jgi:hypothetical protein
MANLITVDNLTAEHVRHYLKQIRKDVPCPICLSKSPLAPLVDAEKFDSLIFTESNPFDAYGSTNPNLAPPPLIPIICDDCGYIANIAAQPILAYLFKEGYNE